MFETARQRREEQFERGLPQRAMFTVGWMPPEVSTRRPSIDKYPEKRLAYSPRTYAASWLDLFAQGIEWGDRYDPGLAS